MENYFPFEVQFLNGALYGSPEQMYRISAAFDTPPLANYKTLFDRYGAGNGLISLVEVVCLIIEGNALDLLDHMDFDEEGYLLDMHTDSMNSAREFAATICPIFRNTEELESYVRKIAWQ